MKQSLAGIFKYKFNTSTYSEKGIPLNVTYS